MSRLPTAVIRLGTTRGRIKAFSIRRNSSPEREMYDEVEFLDHVGLARVLPSND